VVLKAVVFDLDDTLYAERDYVFSGFDAVARWAERDLGIPHKEASSELHSLFEAGVRGDTFNRWLTAHGYSEAAVPELVHEYRSHEPRITPFDDGLELLERLRLVHRLALVTDGDSSVQRRKLKALGLTDAFDVVILTDEWGEEHWKPSSRAFTAVLEKFGITGGEAAYVADNPLKDFHGARRAGMWTIRLRLPGGVYSGYEAARPDFEPHVEANSLAEVSDLLRRIPDESRAKGLHGS
jgi:putative hydrolase of the HAD superfamily